jgi:hypothetical protein
VTAPNAWPPRTEEQLQRAADDGLLVESHTLYLKRQLGSDNKKTAADLAAFSVDGGIIIVGVDETEPPTLNALNLKGLGERVEQIGLSTVDEPVQVTTYDIGSAADPTVGYLVVEVPVSGRAPHMVDGRYYSRGDKTNIVLSDAEVMRWHDRKIKEQNDLSDEARDELERLRNDSPQPITTLLIIAKPLGARRDLLMALSTSTSWRADVADLLHSASVGCHSPASTLREPTHIDRHPDGIIAVADLTPQTDAAGSKRAEMIFDESSGQLTLMSGGLIRAVPGSSPALRGVAEPLLLGHTEFIVRLAGIVSAYGFSGSWRFAIAANMLGKTRSYTLSTSNDYDDQPPAYNRFGYERAYTASLAEITASPQVVVRELVAPLLRSLSSEGQWPWLFA